MTYPEALKYVESFINYEKLPAYPYKESLKLQRIKDFLKLLGNPHKGLRCIHVAGTKGKGSTCAFLTYILRETGYKVGLYTSPHLSDFRERIRILTPGNSHLVYRRRQEFEGMIAKKELAGLVTRLRPVIERYNKGSSCGPLSFFEVYTALAFLYFKERMTDFVVLETGLGGRLDATNVADPLVCAITPISHEHTQKLGNTLREIATEKAGIIKTHGVIVISGPQASEVRRVIKNKCRMVNAQLYEVGKDITSKIAKPPIFTIKGIFREYVNLKANLLGEHQRLNASIAVGIIEALSLCGVSLDEQAIRRGLAKTLWPGRCEVVFKNPFLVLDGAQNIASARALKKTIGENFRYKKLILILGISSDKDIKGICSELSDLADEIIATRAKTPRATRPELLAGYFKKKKTVVTSSIKEALQKSRAEAKKGDLILVTGSLFVVGEARNELQRD